MIQTKKGSLTLPFLVKGLYVLLYSNNAFKEVAIS